ncbi:MAG: T9SS type A sorting domain-containing protein [Emticicia sp.]|nr:T9SS type A sorting domain-containing protein [Emticicia sp.]
MKKLLLLLLLLKINCLQGQQQLTFFGGGPSDETFPTNFIKFNNMLFFAASDTSGSRNIWQSDGTNNSTKLFLKRTKSLNNNAEILYLPVGADSLLFAFDQALWVVGKTMIPKKIYENNQTGFFKVFRKIGQKLFLNSNSFIDLSTLQVVFTKNEPPNNAQFLESLNVSPKTLAFYDGQNLNVHFAESNAFWKIPQQNNINLFGMTVFEQEGNLYGYTSINEPSPQGSSIYGIVKITENEIITLHRFEGFLPRLTNRGLILTAFSNNQNTPIIRYIFKEGNALIKENIDNELFEQFSINYELKAEQLLVLAKYKNQNRWGLFVVADSGSVFVPKNQDFAGGYCGFYASTNEHYFVYCTENNAQQVYAVDKNTYQTSLLPVANWEYGNVFKFNNWWIGTTSYFEPTNFLSSSAREAEISSSSRRVSKLYSTKEPTTNLFTKANSCLKFVVGKVLIVVGNDSTNKAIIYQIDSTLRNTKLLNLDYSAKYIYSANYNNSTLAWAYFDAQNNIYKQFYFDVGSKILKESTDLLTYSLLFNAQNTKVYLRDSLMTVVENGITTNHVFEGLKATFGNYGRFLKNDIIYAQNAVPSEIYQGNALYILDYKRKILFQPFENEVRFMATWADMVIVVHQYKVYAFRADAPFQKKYLFSLNKESSPDNFRFITTDEGFILHTNNEIWKSDGNCSNSKELYVNLSSQSIKILAIDKNILFWDTAIGKIFCLQPDGTKTEFEYTIDVQGEVSAINDHTIFYRRYDNGTIRLIRYDFITKVGQEIAQTEGFRSPFTTFYLHNLPQNQYIVQFADQVFYGKNNENKLDEIVKIPYILASPQANFNVFGQNDVYFLLLNNNLLAIKNGEIVDLALKTTQGYIQFYETNLKAFFTLPNNDILVIRKNDLLQKIIKSRPEWQTVNIQGMLGNSVFTLIFDNANSTNLWSLDDEIGQTAYGRILPKEIKSKPNDITCEDDKNFESTGNFEVSIFPNPVQNELRILTLGTDNNEPLQAEIFDRTGKRIKTEVSSVENPNYLTVQTVNLYTGLYIIKITKGNQKSSIKFVKN